MWPAAAWLRPKWHRTPTFAGGPAPRGISTVIPSRNGRELLETQFPTLLGQALDSSREIIVVDNGSDDGTAGWLGREYPEIRVIASAAPLSFSRAVNRGIAAARYSHVCLLNNDMLLEPGFFSALERAFHEVPDLFCATAQIRFPAGVRREETGKAVMAQSSPDDFPVRCDEPLAGEDGTWVLYGSGGCSLYDAAKLRALGNLDEAYEPAYVEDMDIGWRAWQQCWPSVYVAGAVVEHRHRATTSRYYSEAELNASRDQLPALPGAGSRFGQAVPPIVARSDGAIPQNPTGTVAARSRQPGGGGWPASAGQAPGRGLSRGHGRLGRRISRRRNRRVTAACRTPRRSRFGITIALSRGGRVSDRCHGGDPDRTGGAPVAARYFVDGIVR